MALKKIILNGTAYQLGEVSTCIYDGVEISEDWSDIQAAAQDSSTSELNDGQGLRVADYKTFTTEDNYTIKAQVAGINTYHYSYNSLKPHVDFISKDCYPTTVVWNQSTTDPGNNGISGTTNPFMASYVYSYLEDTIYTNLPEDLQAVIGTKRLYAETRYSSSGLISDSTGNAWISMPHLWLPTEYEVFGSTVLGTKGYSARDAVQYPIFANSWYHRMKGSSNGASPCHWWLATSYSGTSTNALYVNSGGAVRYTSVSNTTLRVPVCFRVC